MRRGSSDQTKYHPISGTGPGNPESSAAIKPSAVQILTFRDISIRVRRRFPNIDSIKKAGFLTDNEEELLEGIDLAYNKYWVPINWAISLSNQANSKGYVISAPGMVSLIQEIKTFRNGLATICNFDWCPIPIAYPQVVFFAVRIYFLFCLITRQYIRVPVNS